MRFDQRTVMITGAAGHLGRAVAQAFAELGANLVLLDAREEKSGSHLFIKTDLRDAESPYQFALYDTEEDRAAGMGNSFPLRWDDALENLPETGWDWAFTEAVKNHKRGITPNYHCAIQIIIHPDYRNQRLSAPMIQAARAVTKAQGLQALIIPIRPREKSDYPLISMDDYITWKNEDGLPFDAWLRAHIRAGARIIKVCHESKTARGTRADWEEWTGMKFPQTGEYVSCGVASLVSSIFGPASRGSRLDGSRLDSEARNSRRQNGWPCPMSRRGRSMRTIDPFLVSRELTKPGP